jgi:hypothetical protein
MLAPTDDMKACVLPPDLASAGQSRYDRGLPMVTATTMTAMRRAESRAVEIRKGRRRSQKRM